MSEDNNRLPCRRLFWSVLIPLVLAGAAPASGAPPDPRDFGPFPTAVVNLSEGCSFDLDGMSLDWTDPPFGFVDPIRVDFGDSDLALVSETCPGFPAELVDMKSRIHFPGSGAEVASGGPFPFVIFMHGQQALTLPGFEGYDYLGELLASHGFIVASIDGRSLLDSTIKSRGEHIREHLRRFANRNQPGSGSFLSGQLDMSRTALVGHSRGGDAVVAAWEWQRVDPDPGYSIAAIVTIAPTQFFGVFATEPPFVSHIRDVDYQILHGSLDCDVADFQGLRHYDRAADHRLVGDTLKSMVYVKDANHKFFNTVWEADGSDCEEDQGPVLAAPLAQDVAKVYIHAFLQSVINASVEFREFLTGEADNPVAGTTVALDFQAPEGAFTPIDHFEELPGVAHDKTINTAKGPVTSTDMDYEEQYFSKASASPRDTYPGDTHAAYLRWTTPSAEYESRFPRAFRLERPRGIDRASFIADFYEHSDLFTRSFSKPYTEPIDFFRSCVGELFPFTGCMLDEEQSEGNNYSVQWEGRLIAPDDGEYTFTLAEVDDGARIFLDGAEIVDKGWYWPAPDRRPSPQTVFLSAGSHDIRIDYEQRIRFIGSLQVRWAGPGFADEVIPLALAPTHLSFRVGQIFRDSGSLNPPGGIQDFNVIARVGFSIKSVRVSDFTLLHSPFRARNNQRKTVMSVVRIPLTEFVTSSPRVILGVEFYFDEVDMGEIALDSIRLTR